jgi:hypothetical protein
MLRATYLLIATILLATVSSFATTNHTKSAAAVVLMADGPIGMPDPVPTPGPC